MLIMWKTLWIVRKFQQLTKLMIKPLNSSETKSTSKSYPQLTVSSLIECTSFSPTLTYSMFDLFMVFVDRYFFIYTVFPLHVSSFHMQNYNM